MYLQIFYYSSVYLIPLLLCLIVKNTFSIELTVGMTLRATDPFKCFCGRTYPYAIDLEEHRRARGHFPSHICRSSCKHPSVVHYGYTIRKCGYCSKLCERLDILEDHRITTGHCFCSECELPSKVKELGRVIARQSSMLPSIGVVTVISLLKTSTL